ncbi:MAG: TonB-dependent receptor [Bryobacterales bacterium]|nr:TonB-dependent receptor [Bryobacterales bacterium]
MKTRSFALLAVLCAGGALWGQSQITTGTIQGTISDPSGAVIPNARVVLKAVETGVQRTVATDEQGRYTAPLLEVGGYEITVSAAGFATGVAKGYNLTLGQTLLANLTLSVAATGETITISEEAPIVETSRTEASTLVNLRSVESLPLNGRRFLDLAFLTPGVAQEPERRQISFAGQRGVNNNINIDGADFNQPFFGGQRGGERTNDAYVVSQEAIREFQVVRAGFAPEFGRSTGGVVNVITRSGTNQFHGGAFYFLRHKEFAPRDAFGDLVAPTRQQFGGSLGGPIRKDKTFFFTVYDQQAQNQPLTIRFNSTAGLPQEYLAKQGIFKSTNDVHTYLAKIDHQLTDGTRLTGRYNYSRNYAENGTFTGVQTGVIENNGTERDRTHTAVFNVNTVISPSLLNEGRFQYSYEERPRVNNGEAMDFVSKVGPQVQITGCCYFGGVSYLPVPMYDYRTQVADNVSYIKGGHTLKMGFDWNRSFVKQQFRGNWRGVYIFNNIQNFLNVVNKAPGAVPDQFRAFFGTGAFAVSQHDIAGFVQDSWRVSGRVTLTGGLRYEAGFNPQPGQPNPLLPESAEVPNTTMWQPRLGLSWDVFGKGKTVVRASTGMFYARTPMLLLNQAFNSNGNSSVGSSFTLNPTQIRQAQTIHPEFVFPFVPDTSKAENASYFTAAGIAGLKPDVSFFAPDFRNPRSITFTGGVEQAIGQSFAVGFDWVHVNTVHLERIRDVNLNPPVVGADSSAPPQQRPIYNVSARPNPNFNIMRSQQSSARANYDGYTFYLNKRFARRYQFMSSYTLAYNHDDDSNERNYAGITYADAYNLKQEYSWSRIDIRHRWVFSGSYDLPWNFQVSGILSAYSGTPFSPFTGVDSNRDSQFTDRPIINGSMLARNSFRNTGRFYPDMRVTKRFNINERHWVTLAFDLFNFVNRDNLSYSVSTNESSTTALGSRWGTGQSPLSTFRTLTLPDGRLNKGGANAGSPFQMQIALKYNF